LLDEGAVWFMQRQFGMAQVTPIRQRRAGFVHIGSFVAKPKGSFPGRGIW